MNPITLRCSLLAVILMMIPAVACPADEEEKARQQIYDNFKTAYEEGDWESAQDWAGQLITAKERVFGSDSPELIVSLTNRAAVDLEAHDWKSAQKHAQRGLSILRQQSDQNPQQHIALLLTRAQAELGLHDAKQARDTLYNALRLNKKTTPIDKWIEAEIYQWLVVVAKRQREERDGNAATRQSLKARAEYFGNDTVQMAPYYEEAANWYRSSTQFGEERRQHERTIEVLETHYGKSNVRLATPLMGIAETYMIPNKSPKKAKAALLRAQELNYPDSVAAMFIRVRVLANLADFHIVFDDPDQGAALYGEAWHMMADHADIGAKNANEFFSQTKRLYFKQPENPASSGKGADFFTEGYVELGFNISRIGRLENVKILRSKPIQMKEKLFFDAAKKARYRPRVVDGATVVSLDESIRFSYDYTNR